MKKHYPLFIAIIAFGFALSSFAQVDHYPILEAVQEQGKMLAPDTLEWMKNWKGMDLEDTDQYWFDKISGSTSVNFKIREKDKSRAQGYDKLGVFVPTNDSGNPTTELAYFNLSAILGWDSIFRPAVRYELGDKGRKEALDLMNQNGVTPAQDSNAQNIRALIATGNPLQGCVKAEKDDSSAPLDAICDGHLGSNGGPQLKYSVMVFLQANQPPPSQTQTIELLPGYIGSAYELAREYSVIMILDAVFQQGDRYSGGNVMIRNVEGKAHFYSTDNGGAHLDEEQTSVMDQLGWFSRYDRKTIDALRVLNQFLLDPTKDFLGYHDTESFVVDLGLYFERSPADFARLLQRNIQLMLNRVDQVVAQYGDTAYL